MILQFFMEMDPPTATAQEKQVRIMNGRPVFYEPASVKAAKKILMAGLKGNVPESPIEGPVRLNVMWRFPRGRHKDGEWRITKPDTDNLQKLLKDCMTKLGFWKDDAQVAHENVVKIWTDDPTGLVISVESMKEKIYEERWADMEPDEGL